MSSSSLVGSMLLPYALCAAGWEVFFHLQSLVWPRLLPSSYGAKLTPAQRQDWNVRVISVVHAVASLVYIAYGATRSEWAIWSDLLAYEAEAAWLLVITGGYFVWDITICLRMFKEYGWLFTIHAVQSLAVLVTIQHPFFLSYGYYLLWVELSTPFVHINWLLLHGGMGESLLTKVNDLLGMVLFVGCRIGWATYILCYYWVDLYALYQSPRWQPSVHAWLALPFCTASIMFNMLNWTWFIKIAAIKVCGAKSDNDPAANGTKQD